MSYSHRLSKPKPVTIVVRIEKEQCDFLARKSRSLGVSMSEYVRKVLKSYMTRLSDENKAHDIDGRL